MTQDVLSRIANAVLYEGYLLYPYRASAIKNRQRFNFGVLVPQGYSLAQSGSESSIMQTECLVRGEHAVLNSSIRFLHLLQRQVTEVFPDSTSHNIEFLNVDGQRYQSWQEAQEREALSPELTLSELVASPTQFDFEFPANEHVESIRNRDDTEVGRLIRTQQTIRGTIALQAQRLAGELFRISLTISNTTPLPDAANIDRQYALLYSFASTHAVLNVIQGQFISLLEPPDDLVDAASKCQQIGCWPVLVGEPGDQQTILASPIILYDYPQIAEGSPGDFFDGTEMDEMLMLRVMTMTPEEHHEMRQVDEQARSLLERAENITQEQLQKLHGKLSGMTTTP